MDNLEFQRINKAADLAINRVIAKGPDDVFRPPIFSLSIEARLLKELGDEFSQYAKKEMIKFLRSANLEKVRIGPPWRGLVAKDQFSFRQCTWLDPLDAAKYLAVAYLLFDRIEENRLEKLK